MTPVSLENERKSSQLPKVLLQMNPALERKLTSRLEILEEFQRKRSLGIVICSNRNKRKRVSRWRSMKQKFTKWSQIDNQIRKAIDAIKLDMGFFLKDGKEIKTSLMDQKKSLDKVYPWSSSSQEPWTSQSSSVIGGLTSAEWPTGHISIGSNYSLKSGLAGAYYSVMSSRRSSLRSVSQIELEEIGLIESPGPVPTEDPLPVVKHYGSVVGSRRSSLGSSLMPEVVVTRQRGTPPLFSSPTPVDESRLTAPEASKLRIWRLLPAPTPTRFVGKMHAVVSSGDKRTRKETFSRGSSIVTDIIKEDEDGQAEGTSQHSNVQTKQVQASFKKSEKDGFFKKMPVRSLVDDKTEINEQKQTMKPLNAFRRSITLDEEQIAHTPVAGRMNSATSRRKVWRTNVQKSKDLALQETSEKEEQNFFGRQFFIEKQLNVVNPRITLCQRNSKDVLETFETDIEFDFDATELDMNQKSFRIVNSSQVNENMLSLPGMKRPFTIDKSELLQKEKDDSSYPLKKNNEETNTSQTMSKVISTAGRLQSKTPPRENPDMQNGYGTSIHHGNIYWLNYHKENSLSGKFTATIGDLVKGMTATKHILGKIASIKANSQTDDDGIQDHEKKAIELGADEKWDWMTGVPTSIRFLARSWRSIARGPGGIVTDTIWRKEFGNTVPDFSGTVNMLTVLAKADIKLKSQMKDEDEDISAITLDCHTHPKKSNLHHLTLKLDHRQGSYSSTSQPIVKKPKQCNSSSKETSQGTRMDNQGEINEVDWMAQKLFDELHIVKLSSIQKWNVDKNIKEEGHGNPFFIWRTKEVPISNEEN